MTELIAQLQAGRARAVRLRQTRLIQHYDRALCALGIPSAIGADAAN